MRLDQPPVFSLHAHHGNHLKLSSPEGHTAHVFVLEDDIVRLMVLPGGHVHMPRTWAVAPGLTDLPPEGRDRFDLSGFALPRFELEQADGELSVCTRQVRLRIRLAGLHCSWDTRCDDGSWQTVLRDRATQAYNFGWWDQRVYHYVQREPGERYYGLGERAGEANRAGQRYRMCNLDPMGYSARHTDPLYKHIPFYITRSQGEACASHGLFYDTLAECVFDMGREMDNYHGPYRHFVAEHGDLDLYFIAGAQPADITRRYTWLTGRPAFAPRHALGYSGSTMGYTDAPDAHARMDDFLQRCAEHDIPCDSFHLSSGYTSIGKKRYVFHWNREKFPDPAGFVQRWRDHGVQLCANIKPALLRDHPRFAEASQAGLLVQDPDGQPTATQFWDDSGAYLDFTQPATITWWKACVTESLLEMGVAATWNDNNEYEIWSAQARIHGFGQPRAAREARPLQTLLMMQASHSAQAAFSPDERPWLVSRSGMPGMQRYVQTWSGDNRTSWETLRYNIRMGLGLAISGISHTGHDVGGFSGPAPDPELWLRWVQFGIFMPRFSIHSWNDDGSVNEPWMYPQTTPAVRGLMQFRCRLMPYLYHLLWRYHSAYEPMIRPTWHDFPADAQCDEENDDMLLGPDLLVAAVVEPGQRERRVWLPGQGGWYDWRSGALHTAGQWITLAAPLDGPPPLLAREGCAIPLNTAQAGFRRTEDERGFRVFPFQHIGDFESFCFEDDGLSNAALAGQHGHWRVRVSSQTQCLRIEVHRLGPLPPTQHTLSLWLPPDENRPVELVGACLQSEQHDTDQWRRLDIRVVQ
ncbi:TIM-barrel domain-containing protein [Hydrogenophaga defluvii]|uniref:TIM-barrel domain-containing protein n=1 Tax=Hydrogenophaga defluvii TaxID=249410 RepID=A0ABW2SBK7_9BURK